MPPSNLKGASLATRLAFLSAGFVVACWAPLVPFAKARLGVDDRQLGFILLCVGIGSVVTMPVTGWLGARLGSRPLILAGGWGIALLMPVVAVANSAVLLGAALFCFGACIGTLDVAMNTHAVEVEKQAQRPLMSGYHAMYSLGGVVGAGFMTGLLTSGLRPAAAAVIGAVLTAVTIGIARPRLLSARGAPTPFVLPHGYVMLLAVLAAIAFLVEGAVLDWGALLIVESKAAHASEGGLGYLLFSISMTACRFAGDRIVVRVGNARLLFWGALATIAGIAVLLTVPVFWLAMTGFLLIGLGASNIVPVLFRLAGNQTVMPSAMAVAALTTVAYGGVLAGPALVGFVSHALSLPSAFWCLAGLMAMVAVLAGRATREQNGK